MHSALLERDILCLEQNSDARIALSPDLRRAKSESSSQYSIRESGAALHIPLACDLLELGYRFPSITDETGIKIRDAEAVHTGPFEISSPREQCVSGCSQSEEVGH